MDSSTPAPSLLDRLSPELRRTLGIGGLLTIVVLLAFLWIDSVVEQLVRDSAREKARGLIEMVWLKVHWETWETDPQLRPFVKEMIRDFQSEPYSYRILAIRDQDGMIQPLRAGAEDVRQWVSPANSEWEEATLVSLREEWKRDLAALCVSTEHRKDGETPVKAPPAEASMDLVPKYAERWVEGADEGQYQYYQPANFKPSCHRCHSALQAVAGAPGQGLPANREPFRVVNVILPANETIWAICRIRAIVLSLGIVVLAVSWAVLYFARCEPSAEPTSSGST